jgi:hypothetical protein
VKASLTNLVRAVVAATALCAATLAAQAPLSQAAVPARSWLGREALIETHLRGAEVTSLEEIGTGVTRPRRGHLMPREPFESLVWKLLPPGRRGGFWESYKSEIAAYELDKLLDLRMVPPAVERSVNGETGAAIMWLESVTSVAAMGGKVPAGAIWGHALRKMMTFDNLIANIDRNAGNILIGAPGELILIDHSRAFTDQKGLPKKIERVDAELWGRIAAITRSDLSAALGRWIDDDAIDAMLERRTRMANEIDKLVKKKGRAAVVIP